MTPPAFLTSRSLALEDGSRLAYRIAGEGPVVLCLHGWPTSGLLWRRLAGPVLESGHSILAPDLLGLGRSLPAAGTTLGLEGQADALDALVERLGIERVALVVHDLGGPVGLAWAVRRPERVACLVLLNTLLFPERLPMVRVLVAAARARGLGAALSDPRVLSFLLRLGRTRPGALPRDVRADYLDPSRTREGRLALRAALADPEPAEFAALRARVPALARVPAAIGWARLDPVISSGEGRRVAALLPHASWTTLPRAGHFVPEDAPADVADLVLGALAAPATG